MATKNGKNLPLLVLSSLGVVFGDIGTSPLYALKLSVEAARSTGASMSSAVYGVLSLITWAIIIVVSIKYVLIIMRADNHGEGGVFALTALLHRKMKSSSRMHWVVTILGTLGAALFFGDSLITPAISVLSAVEGLKVVSPQLGKYVIYISIIIISILFAVEKYGTSKIGVVFGPIMLVWFITIAYFGLIEIIDKPEILRALNPMYGLNFLLTHKGISIAILGAIVLAITGGEALYSDMGHFGRASIKYSWFCVAFPALLLNYFGQGALLIAEPTSIDNPFYRLAPDIALIPLIILAGLATIIASQAVISGVFSITSQAVQLGYIPRFRIKHTSANEFGEVYLSKINLALFTGVILLIIGFKNSENLAHAYGISVTGAMLIDTILASFLLITIRKWNKLIFIPIFACLFIIDSVFLSANLLKFFEGGWLPIFIAAGLLLMMLSWINGRNRLLKARWQGSMKLSSFISSIARRKIRRVDGTAIFFVPNLKVVPMALLHNLEHNKILHKRIICLHLSFENFPKLGNDERLIVKKLGSNFYTVIARYGFQEEPNIPRVLALLRASGFPFDMSKTSFFVGKIKVIAKDSSIISRLFIYMHRMMMGATEYYKIPKERTVELGGVIEI